MDPCCYSIYIRELLKRLGEEPSRYDAHRLRAFVLDKSRSCGEATVKQYIKALRMFLRFLIAEGHAPSDWMPPSPPWSLAPGFSATLLQPDDVERLIASCDPASAVGRRDRAILLLLARLGLRAGDIVHLRLSDIDWEEACDSGLR